MRSGKQVVVSSVQPQLGLGSILDRGGLDSLSCYRGGLCSGVLQVANSPIAENELWICTVDIVLGTRLFCLAFDDV